MNTVCQQPFRVSIAGPIGCGKTLLINSLSKRLWPAYNLAVATVESLASSLFSSGDPSALFLQRQGILPPEHIRTIAGLSALSEMDGGKPTPPYQAIPGLELIFVEYAGNDLAQIFNTELVDATVYMVDLVSGKEVICRGGTGLIHSDLLILNKTDLAPYLGISLVELQEAVRQQRGDRPFVFTDLHSAVGLDEIVRWLEAYLLRPVEQRSTKKENPALIEEQWFWRYKMSRGAHTHFDTTMRKKPLSSAPMSAAPLCYTDDDQVAWDQMWTDFCDLAAIGGPPHRGTLLEPVSPAEVKSNPEAYAQVVAEIERGIQLVTGLTTVCSPIPGWVGVECADEMMATWLQQAILAENVSVRRDSSRLYLPAGPTFQLKAEIKNVITVIAKTHHYWQEHLLLQTS
jgi:urease accessory protein UreG